MNKLFNTIYIRQLDVKMWRNLLKNDESDQFPNLGSKLQLKFSSNSALRSDFEQRDHTIRSPFCCQRLANP